MRITIPPENREIRERKTGMNQSLRVLLAIELLRQRDAKRSVYDFWTKPKAAQ